ncbi:hypothetical protein J4460_04680, partial [Candidatus Woesearchaeota archaeon]
MAKRKTPADRGPVSIEEALLSSRQAKQQVIDTLKYYEESVATGVITRKQSDAALKKKYKGTSPYEWIRHYERYIKQCEQELVNVPKKPVVMPYVTIAVVLMLLGLGLFLGRAGLTGFAAYNESAPAFMTIPNISISSTENYTMNLSSYLTVWKNYTYLATATENITVHVDAEMIIIEPDLSFSGTANVSFIASDFETTIFSDVIEVNITLGNRTVTYGEEENASVIENATLAENITPEVTNETAENVTEELFPGISEEENVSAVLENATASENETIIETILENTTQYIESTKVRTQKNLTIYIGMNNTYDMRLWFNHTNSTTYIATGPENVSVDIDQWTAILVPSVSGTRNITFYAFDENRTEKLKDVLLVMKEALMPVARENVTIGENNTATNVTVLPQEQRNVTRIVVYLGVNITVDLDRLFNMTPGMNTTYLATSAENVSVDVSGSILTIFIPEGIRGNKTIIAIAMTQNETLLKPLDLILTSKPEESVKAIGTVRINSPVRMSKKVVLASKTENVTVTLPKEASEISVVKVEDEKNITVENATVTKNGRTVDLATLQAQEKRSTEFAKITGASVLENVSVPSWIKDSVLTMGSIMRQTADPFGVTDSMATIQSFISQRNGLSSFTGAVIVGNETSNSTEVVIEEPVQEVTVEYTIPGPRSIEEEISSIHKKIDIVSEEHYENVTAYTVLPREVPLHAVNVYWIQNGTRQKLDISEHYDYDNNSLVDEIEWIVPHLSNQTFDVEITVMNVQSYPSVGGNWTVYFDTTGAGNLTITPITDTTWAFNETPINHSSEGIDLNFLGLACGNVSVAWITVGDCSSNNCSVRAENFSCGEIATEISAVRTPGEHHLRFDFGATTAYANNDAASLTISGTTLVCGDLTNYSSVTVTATGTMQICNSTSGETGYVNFTLGTQGSFTVQSGGKVDGKGRGGGGGAGRTTTGGGATQGDNGNKSATAGAASTAANEGGGGGGQRGLTSVCAAGGGGSFGGAAGTGSEQGSSTYGVAGKVYNASADRDLRMGSGGGGGAGDTAYTGGTGGAGLKVDAGSGTITIDGEIDVDGTVGSGAGSTDCGAAGGGSGGHIILYGRTVDISGANIHAVGGQGGSCTHATDTPRCAAGGAGGGRINIVYEIQDNTSLTYSVAGGAIGTGASADQTPNGGNAGSYNTESQDFAEPQIITVLTIWDETDTAGGSLTKYRNDPIQFWANYSNSTGFPVNTTVAPGVSCNISIENGTVWTGNQSMTYNGTSKFYQYTLTSGAPVDGSLDYTIWCAAAGYTAQTTSDTYTITTSPIKINISTTASSTLAGSEVTIYGYVTNTLDEKISNISIAAFFDGDMINTTWLSTDNQQPWRLPSHDWRCAITITDLTSTDRGNESIALSADFLKEHCPNILNATEKSIRVIDMDNNNIPLMINDWQTASRTNLEPESTHMEAGDVNFRKWHWYNPSRAWSLTSDQSWMKIRSNLATDFWGAYNNGIVFHQEITGDYDIQVKFNMTLLINWASQGGLFQRESDTNQIQYKYLGSGAGATPYLNFFKGGTGGWAIVDGTDCADRSGAGYARTPMYYKIMRVGNDFEPYYKGEGEAWSAFCTGDADDVSMQDTIQVGYTMMDGGSSTDYYTWVDFINITPGGYTPEEWNNTQKMLDDNDEIVFYARVPAGASKSFWIYYDDENETYEGGLQGYINTTWNPSTSVDMKAVWNISVNVSLSKYNPTTGAYDYVADYGSAAEANKWDAYKRVFTVSNTGSYRLNASNGDISYFYVGTTPVNRTLGNIMTNDNGYFNFTIIAPATEGTYNLTVNVSYVQYFAENSTLFQVVPNKVPGFSTFAINNTSPANTSTIQINVTLHEDIGGSFWIFSWNATGVWENITNGTWSGTSKVISINLSLGGVTGSGINYTWWANDTNNNYNTSLMRGITITTATDTTKPGITLLAPQNNSGDNDGEITFAYNVTDSSNITNCSLIIGGKINITNMTITKDTRQEINIGNLKAGMINWNINCSDAPGNINTSENRTLHIIITTGFENTTNTSTITDIENVPLMIEKQSIGKISYQEPINLSGGMNISALINITTNSIAIDTNTEPRLNKSANLTLYNLNYTQTPVVTKDEATCLEPECSIFSYSNGELSFNVSHFTNYQTEANAQLTIWDDTDDGTVIQNNIIRFYANYSKTTDATPITIAGTNCSIKFNDTNDALVNMTYESSSKLWKFNTTYATAGNYLFNISCNATSYEQINLTDTFNITTSTPPNVTNITIRPTEQGYGQNVTIGVTVDDNTKIDKVIVGITHNN